MSNTSPSPLPNSDDSNSDVQTLLESEVCSILPQLNVAGGRRVSGHLAINGASVKVDAVFETAEEKIYAEIYCRLGRLASPQLNKMLADAAKLTLINEGQSKCRVRKMIVLAGDESKKPVFGDSSWRRQFLDANNIEFVHHPLSEDQKRRLREAIARQQRGNIQRPSKDNKLPTAASQSRCD